MTKFAQFVNKPAQDKAQLDAAAIRTVEDFLDSFEDRCENDDLKFIRVVDINNPQIIVEIGNDETELKAAFRRWRLRPFDLAETLEKDGYPMRDIRYIDEINEVRIWLKK